MKRTRPQSERKIHDLSRSPSTVLENTFFEDTSTPLHYDYSVDTIVDRLGVMLAKQCSYFDYCATTLEGASSNSHILKWRGRMLEWYFEVIDHTEHDRSVAALAINFLDRFAAVKSIDSELTQREYSLAAMTCLTLASKLYLSRHNYSCHISINYVLRLAHGSYTQTDVEASELDLLATSSG
ncbi:cyclin-like protein [Fragilaria crotonensis]|nr:cyclin-like protein [Fragilaria crotonensis]